MFEIHKYEWRPANTQMRILWFNWRDLKNPDSGGAEVLTHEIAYRLADKGHAITLFTSSFKGSTKLEEIDNVTIVRDGGKYTVYNKAKQFYKKNRHEFDLVVDEINVKPFSTPKFVKDIPIVALIHQISPEQFTYELPFPVGIVGRYLLERRWLSLYCNIPTITVSNSTRTSLENIGFKKIFVIKEGLSISPVKETIPKETKPIITFIGRLKKHKLPNHAVLAFKIIKNSFPDSQMFVIGNGYLLNKLKKLKIKDITFFGYVDGKKKYELLGKSHIVLVPAIREGWGLVVIESNAMGIPVVAYKVPGLVDSVMDGINGIFAEANNPVALANSAIELLKDSDRLEKLSRTSLEYANQFDWNITASEFEKVLLNAKLEQTL